jgi:hypothetical protein
MHGNNASFGISMADDLSKLQFRLSLSVNYRRAFIQEALRNGKTEPLPVWPIDATIQRIKMLCLKMDPPSAPRDSSTVARLGWQLLAYTWPKKDLSWREKISHLVYVLVITFLPVWLINRIRKALPSIKRFTHKRDSLLTPHR